MVLVGFTLFKEKILDGTKTQTIRKMRSRPFITGDTLHLYWKTRTPQCELLKITKAKEVFNLYVTFYDDRVKFERKTWKGIKELTAIEVNRIALKDGFDSAQEMSDWLYETHGTKDYGSIQLFQVIRW